MFSVLRHFTAWTNWLIVLAIGVLVTAGVASIHAADPDHGLKQGLFVALGTGVLILVQLVDYRSIGRWAWAMHAVALGAIAYTLLPFVRLAPGVSRLGFVPQINGAYCWIDFGLLRFQPAELCKITYVLTLARYLRYRETQRAYSGLVVPFVATLVPVVMILKQPDLGMCLAFIPVLFAMLFAAGSKRGHLLTIAAAGALCIPVLWCMGDGRTPVLGNLPAVVKDYQRQRVYAMLHDDPQTLQKSGFQQHNALIAFGSGGLLGKGTGNIDVGRRIPENHNDMIFALIGEQWGLWGAGAVLAAYGLIFLAGIEAAGSTRDPFGRLVAVGLTAMLATSAFENLLVVLKLMPVTGVTLPFVSYGGSSLLANFVLAALLINIASRRPIVMGRDTFEFEE
jgi:cell division protein FtsW (lipid II flippase)